MFLKSFNSSFHRHAEGHGKGDSWNRVVVMTGKAVNDSRQYQSSDLIRAYGSAVIIER
jgi:hypothetical protein